MKRHDEDVLQSKVLIAMLVARRKALGLTQAEVAKRIDVASSTVRSASPSGTTPTYRAGEN